MPSRPPERAVNNVVPFFKRLAPKRDDKPAPVAPERSPLPPPPFAKAAFRAGLVDAPVEFIDPAPCVVTGTLPPEVHGTLYRNGPAQFHVAGERIKHWFDGDGKVIAIHLGDNGATYQSRFVETQERQNERRQGKRLYGGLGDVPRRGFFGALRGLSGKNVANTNVAFFGDKLLALYEGGHPYRLDPANLATMGMETLDGLIAPNESASAHPRFHAPTGDLWNFKISYGRKNTIALYRTDAGGHAQNHATFELPYVTMLHDFCLTQTQAVFVISPLVLKLPDLALYLLGLKPMYRLPKLDPAKGSYVVTVPLTGDNPRPRIAKFDTPLMVLHTVNAWDAGNGDVIMDVCDFSSTDSLDAPVAMMIDEAPVVRGMPKIRRVRLDPQGRVHTHFVNDAELEFPKVAPHVMHRQHTVVYGLQWPADKDYVGVPAVCDLNTGQVTSVALEPGCYAGECIPVSKAEAVREDQVYLLSVVLDSRNRTSALHVYDGENLRAGPIATVQLPQVVPHGFHGSFKGRA